MLKMTVDPKTGFLQQTNFNEAFTAERKIQFLEVIGTNPFAVHTVCHIVGIDHNTYYRHIERDPVFRECVKEQIHLMNEKVEGVLIRNALDDKKTLDRIFYLKHRMPKVYNPMPVIESKQSFVFELIDARRAIDKQDVIETNIAEESHRIEKV